jgi:hypothetical protein
VAGYSTTSAARKLGVKPGTALLLVAPPTGWSLADLPADVVPSSVPTVPTDGEPAPDVAVAFVRTAADLGRDVSPLAELIFPAGAVWIAWPRKAAGHTSDVTENLIREVALPLGLVDNKVAAIDTDWSGLRLSWRKELRLSRSARRAP